MGEQLSDATAATASRPPWSISRYVSARRRWMLAGQAGIVLVALLLWQVLTQTELLPPFFFGRPLPVMMKIWAWFSSGEIWPHLLTTLTETMMAFGIGLVLGVIAGLVLGLNGRIAELLAPFITAANAMPRVVLAPIFVLWFGLGIWSKVALGVTLVFFLVFFNVFQGVREVNPVVLANARMMGADRRQLLRTVYIPSATSWVFSSLHSSVGMAFVGSVVGEYLGSERGIGYLILQAEGVFDINAILAGMVVLTAFAMVLDGFVSLIEAHSLAWRGH